MTSTSMQSAPKSIVEAFLAHAEQMPDRLCLTFDGVAYSYGEMRRRILSIAAALTSAGLRSGDRAALYLESSPDFLAAYLGTHLAGGTAVLINPQYRYAELHHILADSASRVCFVESGLRTEVDRVRSAFPGLETIVERGGIFDSWLSTEVPTSSHRLPDSHEIAAIAYTSGTTGRGKGAMLGHRNQVANIQSVCQAWHWTADDHLLLALPLFHVHGLMVGVHGTLLQGASMDLRRGFDAAQVYATLQRGVGRRQVTMFFGVPTMYTRLIDQAQANPGQPPSLRLYVSGSAALSPHTFGQFEQIFGQRILERYGMTETLMNLTNPYRGERRPGTVGMPFPGQEARVVDLRTRSVLPPDVDGEIEVRGPHVFAGYWNDPDATNASFSPGGWFRTGDLGRVSADGYFTITGRAKELIITGGYNVYPREVEDVLERCPGVAEAAVLGRPHPEFGEQVVAVIVRDALSLTPDQVIAFCREHLASYKKPRQVVFVDALPRNALGKVQKHILSQQLGDVVADTSVT